MERNVEHLLIVFTPEMGGDREWLIKLKTLCQEMSPKKISFLYLLPLLPLSLILSVSPFYDVSLSRLEKRRRVMGFHTLRMIQHHMHHENIQVFLKVGWSQGEIQDFAEKQNATILFEPLTTWQRLKQWGQHIHEPFSIKFVKKVTVC